MHELALCRSMVDIVRDQARMDGFERVRRIRVEIGPFAGVEPDALTFGFEVAARGTPAEGARLELYHTDGRAYCGSCEAEVAIRRRFDPCPVCGAVALRIVAGDELRISELEVL